MWFDTHAHLFAPEFDPDRPAAIQRALQAGVQCMLLPNIDAQSIAHLNRTLDSYPSSCIGAMGLHPTSVDPAWPDALSQIRSALTSRTYAAIGEIGLDFYWDTTHAHHQREALHTQLQWAIDMDLPAVIHARNAMRDVLDTISESSYQHLRCVLHAFTGTPQEAERAMALPNTYIGLGGVCTFKKGLDPNLYPRLRLDRIVLETDAPYLTPTPHRGKRNESAYIPLIAEHVARHLGLATAQLAQLTTKNAYRLFGSKA